MAKKKTRKTTAKTRNRKPKEQVKGGASRDPSTGYADAAGGYASRRRS
jgi:hypothetical protein